MRVQASQQGGRQGLRHDFVYGQRHPVGGTSLAHARYLPGQRVLEDDALLGFGRIDAGLVAAVRLDDRGQQAVIELRGTGETLGEASLTGSRPSRDESDLRALVPTLISWYQPSIPMIPTQDVVRATLAVFAARTRQQQDAAFRRRQQSVSQRVAELLVDLWDETAYDENPRALSHLSRFDLAGIVASNRSVVSTICQEFERRDWCRAVGKAHAIIDPTALAGYASRGLPPLAERPRKRLLDYQRTLWDLVRARSAPSEYVA